MGKMKKSNLAKPQIQRNPLEKDITESRLAKQKNKPKIRLRTEYSDIVDSKTSKKILSTARQQQVDLESENIGGKEGSSKLVSFGLGPAIAQEEVNITEEEFYDDLKINAEDEKALQSFQNKSGKKTKNLSEIILDKIAEKQSDIRTKLSDDGSVKIEDIDPRIREMYEGVRDVMKRYRSGKVPKAFKIIPKLKNWEHILFLTEPHNWSAAAMFQGARIFSSVLSQNMAQRFYNLVLLPRIRDDLCEYKRLNVHLYNALKKALFKPAAFMKGIILPLLESGDCTLREAIIFGSIIAKNTIPVLHSSACLLKICEMEYSGANSIFIRIFLDKRYALPYRVVDAAVFHFLRFEHDKREMPVLWHQSLLIFVQRYKNDISSDQKEALFALLRKKSHYMITPEVRRELQAAKCRDEEMMETTEDGGAIFEDDMDM